MHESRKSNSLNSFTPRVYAHRGASHDFPEMSLAAMQGAVEQGADGIECDLRLTRDGVAVAWHDADLTRIAGNNLKVANSSYAELIAVYPILTLEEILSIAISHKKHLALETKHPVPSRGAIEREVARILEKNREAIARSGIDIVLMSFSWKAVRRAHSFGLATVYLSGHWLPLRFNRADAIGPSISTIRKYSSKLNISTRKGRTFCWTVDEASDARLCQRLGVDVIISNRPGFIRSQLENE